MRKNKVVLFFLIGTSLAAHEIQIQTGVVKKAITPTVDFGSAVYKENGFRIGAFSLADTRGLIASYQSQSGPWQADLGQREFSLDQGFLVSNGAYLPWSKNYAFKEPSGLRLGWRTRSIAAHALYYVADDKMIAASEVSLSPLSWLRLAGGAATQSLDREGVPMPLASMTVGRFNESGFLGGVEYHGEDNLLLHARYSDGFLLRALAFRHSGTNPFASGIFQKGEGLAVQWMSESWFAQIFATDSRFGMLRYARGYLASVLVYEERNQLAAASLRNNPTGLHLRVGGSLSRSASWQTLAGIGFADAVFVGGGTYSLKSNEPLEPLLFPSEWYSSVLLQSTSMRVSNDGFKVLALVDTDVVQGFFAATYEEGGRKGTELNFYMRIAGGMKF